MSDAEQYYQLVDKTGDCFEAFANVPDETDYHKLVAAWFKDGRKFTVGDMLAFRDELTDAGFVWGQDFFVRKVKK